MHIWEGTARPKNNDIMRTLEWWRSLLNLSGGGENFTNGIALSRLDGENSVIIIRHTFEDLAEEQRVFAAWEESACHEEHARSFSDYFEGPVTVHRYNVLHSY